MKNVDLTTFHVSKSGIYRNNILHQRWLIVGPCKQCGEMFLKQPQSKGEFCDKSCKAKYRDLTNPTFIHSSGKDHPSYGKPRPDVQKRMKENNPMFNPVSVEKCKQTTLKNGPYVGPRSSNWKGGIGRRKGSYPYTFSTKLKDKIKARDNYECQNPTCTKKDDVMTIHHIDYDKFHNEETNLITLCRVCNSKANYNKSFHIQFYNYVMENRGLK